MSSLSAEATNIIEALSEEKEPFHSDTLRKYLKKPGSREVIIRHKEKLAIDSNAMIRIVFLIAERRGDAKACLSSGLSKEHQSDEANK